MAGETEAALNADFDGGGFGGFEDSPFIGVDKDFVIPNRRYGAGGQTIAEAERQLPVKKPTFTKASFNAIIADSSPEDVFRYQKALAKVGLIKPSARLAAGLWDDTTVNAYRKLLTFANRYGLENESEALELYAQGVSAGMDLDGGGEGDSAREKPFTGSKQTRSKDVDHTDPYAARKLVRDTLRDRLGRAPRKDEYQAFLGALRSAEDSNPVITDTTTNYVEGEATGSTQFQNGGIDQAAYAEEYAQSGQLGREANSFKRDTDYYQAAMSVLGEGGT